MWCVWVCVFLKRVAITKMQQHILAIKQCNDTHKKMNIVKVKNRYSFSLHTKIQMETSKSHKPSGVTAELRLLLRREREMESEEDRVEAERSLQIFNSSLSVSESKDKSWFGSNGIWSRSFLHHLLQGCCPQPAGDVLLNFLGGGKTGEHCA